MAHGSRGRWLGQDIHIHTNLDLMSDEDFGHDFITVPQVGDVIESKTCWGKYRYLSLVVVSREFRHDGIVCIELHLKPGVSISEFYEWYEEFRAP